MEPCAAATAQSGATVTALPCCGRPTALLLLSAPRYFPLTNRADFDRGKKAEPPGARPDSVGCRKRAAPSSSFRAGHSTRAHRRSLHRVTSPGILIKRATVYCNPAPPTRMHITVVPATTTLACAGSASVEWACQAVLVAAGGCRSQAAVRSGARWGTRAVYVPHSRLIS
jgi:hypothetical protein